MTRPDDAADRDPDQRAPGAPAADAADAADAAEQSAPANPAEEPVEVYRGLEVGEWDAVEQAVVVDLSDEDDYR